MARELTIRYVHRVAPRDTDVRTCNTISDSAFADNRTLASALRARGLMERGARIREMRASGSMVTCFPDRGVWHYFTIELGEEA